MGLFGRKTGGEEKTNTPTGPVTRTGKVIQRAESIEGGYKTGSTTYIHLAVDCEAEGELMPRKVIAFRGYCGFAMLPLVKEGDVVRFTSENKASANGHGEYVELLSFEILFEHRVTGEAPRY